MKNILKRGLNKNNINIKKLISLDMKYLKKKLQNKSIKLNKLTSEKKKKVIAFDIGSSMTKIVEGTYYKNNITIDSYIKLPTPKESIIDGEIKKEDELVLKIDRCLKSNGIKAKMGICTNNSTLIINREFKIPKVEDDEIETVVRYEIQQYLPINLDDYILQVKVLDEEKVHDKTKLNVRAIAYPDKIAKGYYNLLSKLNLKPYVLDVNYNTVNKFINFLDINNKYEYKSEESIAFIDMGANFINVNIYKDGKLDFTRIIKAGGNDINEFFYETNSMKFEDVEKLKIERIDLLDEEDKVNILVRQIIDEWIDKIEKIIHFYKNKSMQNNIDKILIFGGCAKLNGLEKYMSEKIGITTRRVRGISKMMFSHGKDDEPVDDFINAIGAIIRL